MDKELALTTICGDTINELKKIPSESVDLIIADPPYNLNKNYGICKDNISKESFIEFSKLWLKECTRILKITGTIYVFMGMQNIAQIYLILENDMNLKFNNWITWYYTQGIGKTKGFSSRHDDILMFTKSNKYIFNLDEIRIPQKYFRSINNMRGANPGNVWKFSHVHYCASNRQNHPTQKPEGLYERMILASSNPHDLVLDPFVGSGTCLRVCQQLKRSCIGIDNNMNYIKNINDRLSTPFNGFDSIDESMYRIPNDLNNADIRINYIKNHKRWFLKNHGNSIEEFKKSIIEKYGNKLTLEEKLEINNMR